MSGELAMRVSADAVRSIDTETTRYPVEFGKATGGVVAFYTGMGDDKLRFNATNFVPSFRQNNGLRFDQFVPRVTLSGPIVRKRAWFFDGLETEFDNIYIKELPANADTDHLLRGSNLVKAQANLTPADIFSAGLLFNDYHSPYDGISSLVPQQSTTKETPSHGSRTYVTNMVSQMEGCCRPASAWCASAMVTSPTEIALTKLLRNCHRAATLKT